MKRVTVAGCQHVRFSSSIPRAKFDNRKHIHESEFSTFHFQSKLKKQPIPDLDSSGQQLIKAAEGLKNHPNFKPENIQNLKVLWEDFAKNEGREIDDLLRQHDEKQKDTSYVNGPWKEMYLSDRRSLMLNYNPSIQLNTLDLPYLDQLRTATAIIVSLARFHLTMRDQLLEPDGVNMGGHFIPLDMSQFENLLFSTRIPHSGMDEIKKFESRHIAVLFRGNFYQVDVINEDDTIRSPAEILGELQLIEKTGYNKKANLTSIASLSLGNRDTWAHNRQRLIDLGNQDLLNIIDSSMTLIVLDDFLSSSSGQSLWNTIAGPGNNRFPDKSFSMIIGKDSSASFTFEHGWGDGKAIDTIGNRVFEDLQTNITNGTPVVTDETFGIEPVQGVKELVFTLDNDIRSEIGVVLNEYEQITKTFSVDVLEMGNCPAFRNQFWFNTDSEDLKKIDIGRNWMKKYKVAADAFQQIGMQITVALLRGHSVCQYEATSMATFKHGRTETIRPATNEVAAAVDIYKQLINNPDDILLKDEFRKKLKLAMSAHNKQMKRCFGGYGFDRHVFALRYHGMMNNISHKLFDDPCFNALNEFTVSTSTLSGPALLQGGFGPVTNDGFGIGYMCRKDYMAFWVSGFQEYGADPTEFCSTAKSVLLDMKDAIEMPE